MRVLLAGSAVMLSTDNPCAASLKSLFMVPLLRILNHCPKYLALWKFLFHVRYRAVQTILDDLDYGHCVVKDQYLGRLAR